MVTVYVWVSHKRLADILTSFAQDRNILRPIDPDNKGYKIVEAAPSFSNIPARFAWTDPMTGIASSPGEIYGKGEVLMQLELDPKKIKSVYAIQGLVEHITNDSDAKKAQAADLVFFEMFQTTQLGEYYRTYQEWIILNQKIIKKIVVDPKILIPILKKSLIELDRVDKKGNPVRYPESKIHNVRADLPNSQKDFLKGLIQKYIRKHAPVIEKQLQKLNLNLPKSCPSNFLL